MVVRRDIHRESGPGGCGAEFGREWLTELLTEVDLAGANMRLPVSRRGRRGERVVLEVENRVGPLRNVGKVLDQGRPGRVVEREESGTHEPRGDGDLFVGAGAAAAGEVHDRPVGSQQVRLTRRRAL